MYQNWPPHPKRPFEPKRAPQTKRDHHNQKCLTYLKGITLLKKGHSIEKNYCIKKDHPIQKVYLAQKVPSQTKWGCPRGVMVKAMDCGIVVSEFVFQLRYYVHFRANTLGNGMNPLILPAMG